jgi:predicted amidohydrolase
MSDIVIAAVQMTSGEDVDANLERSRELVCEAATAGALIVGLPENFAYLGSRQDHRLAIAEELPAVGATEHDNFGPILTAMRALALKAGVWLLLGGFPEKSRSAERISNSSVLLDPEGMVSAIYR